MWEISATNQSVTFLLSCALGGVLCLVFDILRSIRKVKEFGKVAIFFQDILFFVFCALVTFCFLLATTAGELRGFVLVGMVLGAVFLRLTLSRFFVVALSFILNLALRLCGTVKTVFSRFYSLIFDFFLKIIKFFEKPLKKILFFLKKGLKHSGKVVYTNTEEK